jgi:hypothetical protein
LIRRMTRSSRRSRPDCQAAGFLLPGLADRLQGLS